MALAYESFDNQWGGGVTGASGLSRSTSTGARSLDGVSSGSSGVAKVYTPVNNPNAVPRPNQSSVPSQTSSNSSSSGVINPRNNASSGVMQTPNPLPSVPLVPTIGNASDKAAAEAAKRANSPSVPYPGSPSPNSLIGVLSASAKSVEAVSLHFANLLTKVDTFAETFKVSLNDVAAAVAVSSANHQELFNSGSSVITRFQGIEDKLGNLHTQLANIAQKDTVVNVAPSSAVVNNSIDFEPVKKPLEDIVKNMPDKEKADLLAGAQKEALDYEATANNLTLVDGLPATRISPRDAKYLSNAQNMQHKQDVNNEKFDDNDFDLTSLIMPMLSFKGVTSELDAIHGLFDTGLSTNPFNMDFNIFASYSDTKETI